MYNWIDSFIRLPNKALITIRYRDFKGDYPLEVIGMSDRIFAMRQGTIVAEMTGDDLSEQQIMRAATGTESPEKPASATGEAA